jgi:uncharacterized protein YerC
MRREIKKIKESEKKATLEALYKAAARTKGDNATETFINEVLTESEQITIGRRLLIGNLILTGHTQYEIQNILGVSPNTFSRINQWVSGSFTDYDKALKESSPSKNKKASYKKVQPFSFEHLQRNYPMHCLLFTLAAKTVRDLKNT